VPISITNSYQVGIRVLIPEGVRESFRFAAGPFGYSRFIVESFTGREAISSCYSFEIDLMTHLSEFAQVMPASLLRQPASLQLAVDGSPPRAIHGVVGKLSILGADQVAKWMRVRVRLVPALSLLSHRRASRIFQDQTTDKIVSSILDEWGIAYRWNLSRELRLHTYATQYMETDLEFIARLLAEEGLYYFFEQPPSVFDDATDGYFQAGEEAVAAAGSMLGGPLADLAAAVKKVSLETLVLADDTRAYPPIGTGPAALAQSLVAEAASALGGVVGEAIATVADALSPSLQLVQHAVASQAEDRIFDFHEAEEALPETMLLSDYDFRRPMLPIQAEAGLEPLAAVGAMAKEALGGVAKLSLSPAGLSLSGAAKAVEGVVLPRLRSLPLDRYQVYLHADEVEDETNLGRLEVDHTLAQARLEQERLDFRVAEGKGWCRRLSPGYRFCLEQHPIPRLNAQYVVRSVQHSGIGLLTDRQALTLGKPVFTERGSYENQFVCAPAEVNLRPPIPERRCCQVMETATIVGPPGQELHVDEHGRVKVHFHWDLNGARDDHDSCWIRTAQGWSGAGWGSQYIPRIGSEVLVTYLGGNPDRPLIVGCIPNALNPVPFGLPLDATRSGIRTHSSPSNGGFNELSFEDLASQEQVYLRAQRDLDEEVLRNHTLRVGVDETMNVGGHQVLTVGAGQDVTVTGVQNEKVTGNQAIEVGGDHDRTVIGSATIDVQKDLSSTVGGRVRYEFQDREDHSVKDDLTVRVRGCSTTLVGRPEAKRSSVLYVDGTSQMASTGTTEIESEKRIVLRCGDSSILIGPKSIELSSPNIVLRAKDASIAAQDGELKLASGTQALFKSPKIALRAAGASVGLGQNATIDGAKVKLNCGPESGNDPDKVEESKPTEIVLKDKDGKPIPHQRFLITTDDGAEYSGVVDKDGKAILDLKEGGKMSFPDLSDSGKV